ncbi:MAG TPA: hypothetical protein VHK27_04980 [Gammaproteobacteria bacterium]|nr:hypothetical protein [Gammaproteobacteria bacterium]
MEIREDYADNGEPTFSVKDGWRVRVTRMYDPCEPFGDAYAPTFLIYREAVNPVASVYQDENVTDQVLSRAIRSLGGLNTERYLRMFYGVRDVWIVSDYRGMEYWILDTPGWRKHVGIDDDATDVLKGERDDWRAYMDGDVYGIVREMLVNVRTEVTTLAGAPVGEPDSYSEWREIESVWGFYGEKCAIEEAKATVRGER